MKTKKLKTGVVITYDKKGNIKNVSSPYLISETNGNNNRYNFRSNNI